jgi:hypothetical protein
VVRRVFADDRRIDQDHHSVARQPDQRSLMAGDDGSNSFIIFREHGHDGIRFGARGKTGEAAQIAEDRDDFTPLSVQQPLIGVFNQFSHLRRKETFQAIDAFGFLPGDRQFLRHLVEAIRQLLQFVAARDRDAMIELTGADPFNSVLQLPDRSRHAVREPIRQGKSQKCADRDEGQGTPERGADRFERFQDRLLRNHRPTHIGGAHREGDDRFAVIAGGHDRRSVRGVHYGPEPVEVARPGATAQHPADVRVGNKTSGIVDDQSMAGIADPDRGNDIPDQFQVDVGNGNPGGCKISGNRDSHVGLGIMVVSNRAVPDLAIAHADKCGIFRQIRASADPVQA